MKSLIFNIDIQYLKRCASERERERFSTANQTSSANLICLYFPHKHRSL